MLPYETKGEFVLSKHASCVIQQRGIKFVVVNIVLDFADRRVRVRHASNSNTWSLSFVDKDNKIKNKVSQEVTKQDIDQAKKLILLVNFTDKVVITVMNSRRGLYKPYIVRGTGYISKRKKSKYRR